VPCASVHGANRLGGTPRPSSSSSASAPGATLPARRWGEAEVTTGKDGEWEPADYEFEVEVGETGGQGPAAADGGAVATDPDGVLEAEVESAKDRVRRTALAEGSQPRRDPLDGPADDDRERQRVPRGGRLKETLGDLREAREAYKDVAVSDPSRTFNTDLIHTMETRNILDIAEALTMGALARRSSAALTGAKSARSATTRTG